MLPDYHIHTALCNHAEGAPSDYRLWARRQEIPEICFADHAPNPNGYDPKHRMTLAQFSQYREMVDVLQDEGQAPQVLFGIEADYYSGCERFLSHWLPTQGFDFVLGAVHYIDDWGFDNPDKRHVWDSIDVTATWQFAICLVSEKYCGATPGLFFPCFLTPVSSMTIIPSGCLILLVMNLITVFIVVLAFQDESVMNCWVFWYSKPGILALIGSMLFRFPGRIRPLI